MLTFLHFLEEQVQLEKDASEERRQFVITKFREYKTLWNTYKNNENKMPRYKELNKSEELYEQNICLIPNWANFQIHFYVADIQATLRDNNIQNISFSVLDNLLRQDLSLSRKTYTKAKKTVHKGNKQPNQYHKYESLIILNFAELSFHSLLDGHHRYCEHKIRNDSTVPVKIIQSIDACPYIVFQRDFVVYYILHNAIALINFINGQNDAINDLLKIQDFLGN